MRRFTPDTAVIAAFGGLGALLTVLLGAWMMVDNKRRDIRQGVKLKARDVSTEKLRDGPATEDYRWFI